MGESSSSWFKLLVGFGPTLLLIAAFVWISRRAAAAAGGGLFGLGRNRAKRYSLVDQVGRPEAASFESLDRPSEGGAAGLSVGGFAIVFCSLRGRGARRTLRHPCP
ncbi:MAG: hypothetical protein ACHQ9S_19505 [Candidatus Binatia bacterium]